MVHETGDGPCPGWRCSERCRAYLERCGDRGRTCFHDLDAYVDEELEELVFVVESDLEQYMFEKGNLLAVCFPSLGPHDFPQWADDFRGRSVTLCPVATAESRSRMRDLGEELLPLARELRWLELPDLLPKVKRGGGLDQGLDEYQVRALALSARPWPPENELDAATFLARANTPWLIDRLLPAGLTVLTGPPGPGLGGLALELALAVAQDIPPVSAAGPVLYCSLDEPLTWLSARLGRFLAGDPPPSSFSIRADLPALDEGGIGILRDWAYRHPEGRLIVVDGLDQVQPRRADLRLDALTLLDRLAAELGVAILAVQRGARAGQRHHAAGTHHRLHLRTEGARRAVLEGAGGEQGHLLLAWDQDRERWIAQEREAVALSASRQAIGELLAARGPLTPAEISASLGQPRATTRSLLLRMTRDGQLIPEQGRYRPPRDVAGLLPAPED